MFPINPLDSRPIYEQIVDTIKEQVVKGLLKPGDQLPSVRQLASMLTINANTVMKAYSELEHQGVIETVKGKGAFISMSPRQEINEHELELIRKTLKKVCITLRCMGLSKENILSEVAKLYDDLEKGK